jgi:microcompartment protein CcmK/EutM
MRLVVKRKEGILVGIAPQNDRSSMAAVTAVGAAAGNELFTAKGDAAVAAVAGTDVELDAILEYDVFHRGRF